MLQKWMPLLAVVLIFLTSELSLAHLRPIDAATNCVGPTQTWRVRGMNVHLQWCGRPQTPTLASARLWAVDAQGGVLPNSRFAIQSLRLTMPDMPSCRPREPRWQWVLEGYWQLADLDFYLPAHQLWGKWSLEISLSLDGHGERVAQEGICPEILDVPPTVLPDDVVECAF